MSSKKAEQGFMDMLDHFNIWYLIYIFAAIMFFNLGKSFGEVKSKMEERKSKQHRNRHYKKNEEMDEEKTKLNEEGDYLRQTRIEVEESR